MKAKKVMATVFEMPASILAGLAQFLLGSTTTNKHGKSEKIDPGVLGSILDGIKFVFRSIADTITAHQTAIAFAFWSSLAVAGVVALLLFLWPAALSAVATFTIADMSIAGIVGADAMLQIGFAASLAAGAVSAVTYLSAAVVNAVRGIANFFKHAAPDTYSEPDELNYSPEGEGDSYDRQMNLLHNIPRNSDSHKGMGIRRNQGGLFSETKLENSSKISRSSTDSVENSQESSERDEDTQHDLANSFTNGAQ